MNTYAVVHVLPLFCSYRWANRANIGPSEMPVCRTYDEAEEQCAAVQQRRSERLCEKALRLEVFEEEEAERRMKEMEPEEMKAAEQKKEEEAELEVC